uniref:Uncharacterized protein n=1 Tax=viral metagenome TaxID=1070528 RepID=A0A2V0RAD4_9ZZZZ
MFGHAAATWYKAMLHEFVTGGAYTLDVRDSEAVQAGIAATYRVESPIQASNVLHDRRAYEEMWAPMSSAPRTEADKDEDSER